MIIQVLTESFPLCSACNRWLVHCELKVWTKLLIDIIRAINKFNVTEAQHVYFNYTHHLGFIPNYRIYSSINTFID
jgi:hypothetical protein